MTLAVNSSTKRKNMEKVLNTGKLSEAALERSVLKQLRRRRSEVVCGAAVGEDCAALDIPEGELTVMSTDPITGALEDVGRLAVHITANDLASCGAKPIGLMVSLLMPPGCLESQVRATMHQMDEECETIGIEILGGHTEITPAVNRPIVTVTGIGSVKAGELVKTGGAKEGHDIVMTKWAALEGTSIIAKEKREELLKRFPLWLVDEAAGFEKYLSVVPEARIGVQYSVSAMHDVTEGGIFGALWEMAEASHLGLEADLRSIPLRQETVEICNHFDINPYKLISSGSMLMASPRGEQLVRALGEAGINAAVIGRFTAGNDRLIFNKDEKRYLEPPAADELYSCV
jgi:hydrogenase maturation factor